MSTRRGVGKCVEQPLQPVSSTVPICDKVYLFPCDSLSLTPQRNREGGERRGRRENLSGASSMRSALDLLAANMAGVYGQVQAHDQPESKLQYTGRVL